MKKRLIVGLVATGLITAGCVTLPQYPLVYEVVDQPSLTYQATVSSALVGHRDVGFAFNFHPNQGVKVGSYTQTDPDAIVKRISADVVAHHPSMVLIQATQADTSDPAVYNNYTAVIDQLMSSPGMNSRPVIWLAPLQHNLIAPQSVEGAQAITAALSAAEATHSNLWSVPIQEVWQAAYGGSCPVKVGEAWQMHPITECYANLGQTLKLSLVGAIVNMRIIDEITQAQLQGRARDEVALATAIQV